MELTTLEIAAMCQRTERTVQRWLSTGRLKATHLLGNRYEVAEDDLQPFLPHEVVESISERISALEARIAAVEAMLSKKTPRATQIAPTHSTLPDGYAGFTSWCEAHHIAETTARRYLPPDAVKKGTWSDHDGSLVKVAIDRSGQHHLWEIFHHKTKFTPCAHCPHDNLV